MLFKIETNHQLDSPARASAALTAALFKGREESTTSVNDFSNALPQSDSLYVSATSAGLASLQASKNPGDSRYNVYQ